MNRRLLEVIVQGKDIFVLLLNGQGGSQIKLNSAEYLPLGAPIITEDIEQSIREAPELANAYVLSEIHDRTDLHGKTLQAIQFYRIPRKLIEIYPN